MEERKKGSRNRQSRKPFTEMSRRKKVKFADAVSNVELSGRNKATSFQAERNHSPVGDAKTSEYKSFKQLLGEIGCKHQTCHHTRHANKLKQFEADCMEEENNSSQKCDANRTLLPVQKVFPSVLKTSTAAATTSQNCELYRSKSACSSLVPIRDATPITRMSAPIQNVTPIMRMSALAPDVLLNSGPENEYGGIFQEKRKHLLLLAAEASSQKEDEILSNKPYAITKFLQRLGNGRKSSNLDGLPKSVQKVSSSRYDSLTPYESYDGRKELNHYAGRRNMGKKLLAYRGNVADKSITWRLDNIDDREFSAWDAHSHGSQCQRWQPSLIFNAKGNSDLLDENSSFSATELVKFGAEKNMYHTSGHLLSKSEELITYPREYVNVQALPSSDTFNSGLQDSMQHSDTFEKFNSRPTYRVCHSKAVVPAIPCLWSLDSHLQDGKWHSSSLSDEANEHATLSGNDELKVFSDSHALGCAVRSRRWDSSSAFRISDFAENRLASSCELNSEPDFRRSRLGATDHMQLNVGCDLTEQDIAPYIYSSSSRSYLSCSPEFRSELRKWNDEFEQEPLALYTAPDETDFTLSDVCRRAFSCSPQTSPLGVRPSLELEWKSSPIKFDREIDTNFCYDGEHENGVHIIATEERYYEF